MKYHRIECPKCEGSGYDRRPCGYVDGYSCACESYGCPECDGRGTVLCDEGAACEVCESIEATAQGLMDRAAAPTTR